MEIRDLILIKMQEDLTGPQLEKLKNVLDIVLHDYTIEKKSYDVQVYNNANDRIVKQYIASMRLGGLSEKTIEQYYRVIQKLLGECGKDIKDIMAGDIRYFLAIYQQTHNISNVSLENYRIYISSFFSWLIKEEYISKNPMDKIPKGKVEIKKREAFTSEELEKIKTGAKSIRDRALIEFLYSTGCRVSEVVAVNINDIDFNDKSLIVKGKGNKERKVYISSVAMFWLRRYLKERDDENDYLFSSKRGKITKEGIEFLIRDIGNRVGVNAFPHRFRHTLATDLARKGVPLQEIQQILGHTNIQTTLRYCAVDDSSVQNAHKKYVA